MSCVRSVRELEVLKTDALYGDIKGPIVSALTRSQCITHPNLVSPKIIQISNVLYLVATNFFSQHCVQYSVNIHVKQSYLCIKLKRSSQ